MKKYIPYIAILILGIVIGALCREHHSCSIVQNPQRDTIKVKVIESYGRMDLWNKTYKINIPQFDIPDYYYIRFDSTKIEYRDSIKYVVLPSESYRTKVGGIDIYHHGVRSVIDSVNVEYYRSQIREQLKPREWKHTISVYGSAGYLGGLRLPVGVQYLYHPARWFGVGGKVEHDFALSQTGVYATANFTFGW